MHQSVDPDDIAAANEWLRKTFMEGKPGLMDLLDQAYHSPGPNDSKSTWTVPPGEGGPHRGYIDLMAYVRLAQVRFDCAYAPQHPAYAVLMNPEDKLMVQQEAAESMGVNLFVEPDKAPNMYCGLIMQPAHFIERGHYMIICKEDYDKLNVPENIS